MESTPSFKSFQEMLDMFPQGISFDSPLFMFYKNGYASHCLYNIKTWKTLQATNTTPALKKYWAAEKVNKKEINKYLSLFNIEPNEIRWYYD